MSSPELSTRERLLDVTRKRLEAAPRTSVRMADIARDAGISRQALYLHFPTRAALLIATARHLDAVYDVDARLADSRAASTDRTRMTAFVAAWCGYIPLVFGVAQALMAMRDEDEAARAAWDDRMTAVRAGCRAAVDALAADGDLASWLTPDAATDIMKALLSVEMFAELVHERGWAQADYEATVQRMVETTLVANMPPPG